MLRTLGNLFDTLFPPSESARQLRGHDEHTLLRLLTPQTTLEGTALLPYNEPLVRAAITACKFEQHARATQMLGTVLSSWLETLPTKKTLIQPVPLSRTRLRRRGHNQVLSIIQSANLPDWCMIETNLLIRNRDTAPQTSLTRAARLHNITHAFSYTGTSDTLAGFERCIILDDVLTTGATLQAARATLAPHTNLPIIGVALAH